MPVLAVPLTQEFYISDIPGVTDDDPIVVSVRQCNEGDNIERSDLLPRRMLRNYDDNRDELPFTPAALRRAVDVWLAMKTCNIRELVPGQDGETRLMFPSTTDPVTGEQKLKFRTFNEFLMVWRRVDPEWALAIHLACLYLNLHWAMEINVAAGRSQEDFLIEYPQVETWLKPNESGEPEPES